MLAHRTAQRLRVSDPVLLGQNKLQQNKPQELKSSDFEGSRFDRWLCQGSGQHPLAGSPQDQRAFLFAGRPGEWLAACCSGALAVLSGFGQSPTTGHHYYQSFHQGRDLAGFNALVIWLIWPSKNVIRSLALARSSRSCLTNSLSLAMASLLEARPVFSSISTPSGMLINHWLPTFSPVSNPLVNLRLTVFGETPRALAMSFIESCIAKMVTHVGYPNLANLGKNLPSLLILGKLRNG